MSSPIIIVPAYNVEATIGTLLDCLRNRPTIVVDDGSVDRTGELVMSKNIPLITHRCNRGVGAALKSGIEYGLKMGFDMAIAIDADGQHDPEKVNEFERQLSANDFAIGNRFHDLTALPTQKLCSNLLGSVVVEELFGVRLPDVACGFRGFRLDVDLLGIEADSYDYVFEQLFHSLRHSSSIGVVDIPATYSMDVFLCTRTTELSGFLRTAIRECQMRPAHRQLEATLTKALASTEQKLDFELELGKYSFNSFYIERSLAYVIQTDQCNIWGFHDEIGGIG